MMRLVCYTFCLFLTACSGQDQTKTTKSTLADNKRNQELIVEEYLNNCAENYNYTYDMALWQECLDRGLEKDSTIAILWQKKAMPYFKVRKYEIGMEFLDKAVEHDKESWLDYRAFIKCIFVKSYKDAITDFEACKRSNKNGYVMDHTYDFYIGISYLQLNRFSDAESSLMESVSFQKNQIGQAHFIDLFYYAISKYEQSKFDEAIALFDECLIQYPTFSDALYYKAVCYAKSGRYEDYELFYEEAKINGLKGNTISEDNSIYEKYPYQIEW
ncbi:MAG: tetratricopeptide repeat protein [Nonlabens sp.]|nr:tetratricopeptide repeat protein [Nonlabens sp.]